MKNNTIAVLLAAGQALRMNKNYKQFKKINGIPTIVYSLEALLKSGYIKEIIIVAPREKRTFIEKLVNRKYPNKKIQIIDGGATRRWSAQNAVELIRGQQKTPDFVLFHDAARPFITRSIVNKVIDSMGDNDGAVISAKATDLVLQTDESNVVQSYLKLNTYYGYTPQCFRYDLIAKVYKEFNQDSEINSDDNIELIFRYKKAKIQVVPTLAQMPKLTYPKDFILVSGILKTVAKIKL